MWGRAKEKLLKAKGRENMGMTLQSIKFGLS